ncbi:MAG: hypothetical protein FWJ93_03455 [Micromonosporaceae bacterium]
MLSVSPLGMVLLGVALVAFIALCVWFAVSVAGAPVARPRLERFARRHQLVVTATNGNQVIRYLATTRRWRATGLAAGLIASIGWSLAHGVFQVYFLVLFAGWFAGALIAEVRLAPAPFGPRRAASLVPRQPRAYLPRTVWALLPAAGAISLAVGAASAVGALARRPVGLGAAPLFAVAMLVFVVVRTVQHRVLHRPQPVAEPDVLAADDAIRSRSLHVLAGGGTTLVLYCVLGQLAALAPALPGAATEVIEVVNFLGIFAVPLLGWAVAVSPWPVRRSAGPASALPANGTS